MRNVVKKPIRNEIGKEFAISNSLPSGGPYVHQNSKA